MGLGSTRFSCRKQIVVSGGLTYGAQWGTVGNMKTNTAAKVQIVLARTEEDSRVVRTRRTDLGEAPVIEHFDRPVSAMWLNSGTQADVEKARAYAKTEGYAVFVYDRSVRDALGQAKRDIAKEAK